MNTNSDDDTRVLFDTEFFTMERTEDMKLRQRERRDANRSRNGCSRPCSQSQNSIPENQPIRLMDYLEKRTKIFGWRKYWCVLEGQLLTYYKSKDDWDRVAPSAGSINLGIGTSTVRPAQIKGCKGFPFVIVAKGKVVYLRSQEKPVLDKWLLALQETTSTPLNISNPLNTDPGVQFCRNSAAELSQCWSLQDFSGNITGSLSNLHKNFHSNPDATTLKNKCHSFSSVQSPPYGNSFSYNSAGLCEGAEGGSLSKLPKRNKEMSELNQGGPVKPVRQVNSMLVLDSSRQAMELKRELSKSLPDRSKSIKEHDHENHYDEMIDFEALYDKTPSDGDAVKADPWEKIKMEQSQYRNSQPLPIISEVPDENSKLDGNGNHPTLCTSSSQDSVVFPGVKKKSTGIVGMFQKIFRKSDKKREKDAARRASSKMIITGPVDLKMEPLIKTPPKGGVKESQDIHKNSAPLVKAPDNLNNSQSVLKSKDAIKRTNSELTPSTITTSEIFAKCNLQRRSTIQNTIPAENSTSPVSSENLDENSDEQIQNTTVNLQQRRSSNQEVNPSQKPTPMTLLFQTSISEYQLKLAKFNRLSAHLNPSFIAKFTPNLLPQMNRSSSCKIKPVAVAEVEEPPVLPPKKKVIMAEAKKNAYDYPSNNTPVRSQSSPEKQPTMRELTKKNSAPDIMFNSSAGSREILPQILNQKFDLNDTVLIGEGSPPPRPPKKNSSGMVLCEEYFVNIDGVPIVPKCATESTGALSRSTSNAGTRPGSEQHYQNVSVGPAVVSDVEAAIAPEPHCHTSDTRPVSSHSAGIVPKQIDTDEGEVERLVDVSPEVQTVTEKERSCDTIDGIPRILPLKLSRELKEIVGSKSLDEDETDVGDRVRSGPPSTEADVQNESKLKPDTDGVESIGVVEKSESESSKSTEKSASDDEGPNKVKENIIPNDEGAGRNSEKGILLSPEKPRQDNIHETPNPLNFSPTLSNKSVDMDNLDALSELSDESATGYNGRQEVELKSTLVESPHEILPQSVLVKKAHNESTEKVQRKISTPVLQIIPGKISEKVLEKFPENISDKVLEKVPKKISEKVLEKIPERISENKQDENIRKDEPKSIYENLKYATVNTHFMEYEAVMEEEEEVFWETCEEIPPELLEIPATARATVIPGEEETDNKKEIQTKKPEVDSIPHSGIDELQKYLESESPNDSHHNPATRAAALNRLGHSPAVDKLQRIINN